GDSALDNARKTEEGMNHPFVSLQSHVDTGLPEPACVRLTLIAKRIALRGNHHRWRQIFEARGLQWRSVRVASIGRVGKIATRNRAPRVFGQEVAVNFAQGGVAIFKVGPG